MRSATILTLAAVLCLALAVPATAAKRVALVIGNSGYVNSPLANPANDAAAMSAKLKSLGFEVIHHTDAELPDMDEALEAFYRKLQGAEAGLFYYAGHGMQSGGENYLIPLNSRVKRERDLRYYAMPAGRVLAAMEDAGTPVNVVILDACRDNPFKKSFRSASRGLAVVQTVSGSFVAFATSPGSVAADGQGENGVFTKHILANIDTPGLTIEDVFRKVRQGVMAETRGKQTPWDSSSLTGAFHFSTPEAVAKAAPAPSKPDQTQLAMAEELRKMRQEMEAMRKARAEMEKMRQQQSADKSDEQVAALLAEVERLKTATLSENPVFTATRSMAVLPVARTLRAPCSSCGARLIWLIARLVDQNANNVHPAFTALETTLESAQPLPEQYLDKGKSLVDTNSCDAEGMAALGRELGVDAVLGVHYLLDNGSNDNYFICLVNVAGGQSFTAKGHSPSTTGGGNILASKFTNHFNEIMRSYQSSMNIEDASPTVEK